MTLANFILHRLERLMYHRTSYTSYVILAIGSLNNNKINPLNSLQLILKIFDNLN
jgi:hypothetical protein